MSRCFVTGACGFIGSHLCEALRDAGHEVTGMALYDARGSYGWLDEVEDVEKVMGDVRDYHLMEKLLWDSEADTVFHLAAHIDVAHSYHAPKSFVETNVVGTLNIAQIVRSMNAKLIHTSSSEVYGSAIYTPQDESHPLCAQSPYAATKIAADQMVEAFTRSYGLKAVTLRPFNTYGPRQSERAVIGRMMRQAAAGEQIVLGNIDTARDFTYVTDTVAAFLAVMDVEGFSVYNCGSGTSLTIGQVLTACGLQKDLIIDKDRFRPNKSEVQILQCDASRLQAMTGWKPKVSIGDGLGMTRTWHENRVS
ncbi:MAG: GDP-mannose 4,6-dehydratase [Geminicoccaceae bacterium]